MYGAHKVIAKCDNNIIALSYHLVCTIHFLWTPASYEPTVYLLLQLCPQAKPLVYSYIQKRLMGQ